tara:strand:+ start:3405 stop:4565 length:1161 start_codon:yes stop_codon:yes gene_type:complete
MPSRAQRLSITELKKGGYERVIHATHDDSNFSAYIAIHTLKNGPAFGGVRFWKYKDDTTPLKDVLNLSKAMTTKCAIAGIQLSGGKSVVQGVIHKPIGDFGVDPKRVIGWLGEAINYLKGDYYAGLDVGFNFDMLTKLRLHTEYTATYSDPDVGSSCTAYSVYNSMKAAVEYKLGKKSLEGVKVGIKGLGKVGFQLANYLCDDGAKLYFSETDPEKLNQFKNETLPPRWVYKTVPTYNLHKEELDVYSPCALGNDIRLHMVPDLNCKIICGAANNQLDVLEPQRTIDELIKKDILYIPDNLANVGGVFRSAGTILKSRDETESFKLISTSYPRTLHILKMAENYKVTPNDICEEMGLAASGEGQNRFKLNLGGLGDVKFGNNTFNY